MTSKTMRLLVALDTHYVRGPDGRVYTAGPHRQGFWDRYLMVFDEVRVLARMGATDQVDPTWAPAEQPQVTFIDVPDHTGPWEYIATKATVRRLARQAVAEAETAILRTGGGGLTHLVWSELRRAGKPYGVEVVADPWDALGPGTVKSIVRPLARRLCASNLRAQCRCAAAATYVTRSALQRRYPAGPDSFETYYSDVVMSAEAYVDEPRVFEQPGSNLVQVGSLAHFFKAPDILVQAVAGLVQRGLAVNLRLVGGGRRQGELEELVDQLGVREHVCFVGQLAQREAVLAELDRADVFVLPSRQEGLPRALIEAMGRGLPCVASTRGGMPELLPPEDMVPAEDVQALTDKLAEVLTDPQRLTAMSARNLEVAGEYKPQELERRRLEYYRALRDRISPASRGSSG